MRTRTAGRRPPQKKTAPGLRRDLPSLHSSITRTADGTLFYRGHDVRELARTRSLEEVASLLWTGSFDSDVFDTPLHVVAGNEAPTLSFLQRAQSVLPLVGARDELALDLGPLAVAQTGWRIVNLLTSVAVQSSELAPTVEETLAAAWAPRVRSAPELIRAAIIVCAGGERDICADVARSVASAGSHPYAVVTAALAALEGYGRTEAVDALWDELKRERDVGRAPRLPDDALMSVLAIGRTIRWISEAIQQYGKR